MSPNMDRDTTDPARVALNFTDFIVAPMFVALTSLLPAAQSCCDSLGALAMGPAADLAVSLCADRAVSCAAPSLLSRREPA